MSDARTFRRKTNRTDHDEQAALDEVLPDGVGRPVDQVRLVVEGHERHAARAAWPRSSATRSRIRVDDRLAVLALQHDDHAGDDSPRPSRVTAPWRGIGAASNVGHVAEPERHAVDGGDQHGPQVVGVSISPMPRTVYRSPRCSM